MRFQPWNRVQTGAAIFSEMDSASGAATVPAVVDTEADPVLVHATGKNDAPSSPSFLTTPLGAVLSVGAVIGGVVLLGANMGTTRGRPRLSR